MTIPQTKRNRFTIHIYPHVKKFITKNSRANPLKVDEYSTLGRLITLALRDTRASFQYNDQYRNRLTDTITIILTDDQSKYGPTIGKLMRINIDMDRVFKEALIVWIRAQQQQGIPPYNSCKLFLQYYSIDESEYSLEAAYKYWQRLPK